MSRAGRTRTACLLVALACAAGTAWILSTDVPRADGEIARHPAPAVDTLVPGGATALGRGGTSSPGPFPGEELRSAPREVADLTEIAGLPARLGECVRELADRLRDEDLRHVQWDRELAAASRAFAARDAAALGDCVADPARTREERIACAELLRILADAERGASDGFARGGAPDGEGLEFLRREAPPDGGPLLAHAAAGRALAVFGDDGDRASLVARLRDSSSEVALSVAWSLSAAPREDLALELARVAATAEPGTGDARTFRSAALVALEGMFRREGATSRLRQSEDAIAAELESLCLDPHGSEELGIRAVGLLATSGGERAKLILERALRVESDRPAWSRALARAYLACAAERDTGSLRPWEAHQGRMRLELACASAEGALCKELDVQSRERLAEELSVAVKSERSDPARRRALRALAALGTPAGRALVEHLAQSDPDVATRVVANDVLGETIAGIE